MKLENLSPIEWEFSERSKQLQGSMMREMASMPSSPSNEVSRSDARNTNHDA